MNHQSSVLRSLCIALTLLFYISSANAQYKFGIEAGPTISSLSVYKKAPFPYKPRFGVRGGVFFEREFTDFFTIKTGTFYELKGAYDPTSITNNLSSDFITIPILAIFTPIKWLKVGVGVETGILVVKSPLFFPSNLGSFGFKGELAWQISSAFRLIAHATLDVTPYITITHTDGQGDPIAGLDPANYHYVSGGLSLAYTIKSFDKE